MSLLDKVENPRDIKQFTNNEIDQLSHEIRQNIINTVANTGGHLASSLGVVELTLAWHYVFDSPADRIIWDVGHQSYAHKILTGRKEQFGTLRQLDGISGFPKRSESCHDCFDTGHSATSISAALGLAVSRDSQGKNGNITAVIGDGALTGGMAWEAINHAGHLGTDMLVILNDNEMSIDGNVGAISAYLDKIRTEGLYVKTKNRVTGMLEKIPRLGPPARRKLEKLKDSFKYMFIPGVLFEELGFTYLGPVDGHNFASLVDHLKRAQQREGPKIVHVITEKGKGYPFAEQNPDLYHGVGPFNVRDGKIKNSGERTYTEAFSDILIKEATVNKNIVGITAAMGKGTGLEPFADKFPDRFYDVGIAEQHAVTLAGGLAAGGMKPVVAIYATFMQRAADQVIHDVCMQNLPVIFCADRCGLVGADGETHQGTMDLSIFRGVPNLEILMPSDEIIFENMFRYALEKETPVMIRYPKDRIRNSLISAADTSESMRILKRGEKVCLLGCGNMVDPCLQAAEILEEKGIPVTVLDAWRVKPVDREILLQIAQTHQIIFTVEENCLTGGLGSAVYECLDCLIPVVRIALPDRFIEQGKTSELRFRYNLHSRGIADRVLESLKDKDKG